MRDADLRAYAAIQARILTMPKAELRDLVACVRGYGCYQRIVMPLYDDLLRALTDDDLTTHCVG